jgi:hypothetical protein
VYELHKSLKKAAAMPHRNNLMHSVTNLLLPIISLLNAQEAFALR